MKVLPANTCILIQKLTRGSAQINTSDTSGLVGGMTVDGDSIIVGSTIVAINANSSMTLSNPVGGNGSNRLTAYSANATGSAGMTPGDTKTRTDGRSLKVSKSGIGSTSIVAYIAIPMERARARGELYLSVPGGLADTKTLFFDAYSRASAQGDS